MFPKVKFKGVEIKSSVFKVMGCARILTGAGAGDGLGRCDSVFQFTYYNAFTRQRTAIQDKFVLKTL